MSKLIKVIRHLMHEAVVHLTPSFLRRNMLSCQDVAFILSSEKNISFTKKVKLKAHLLICQCCTDYKDQINFINHQAKKSIKLNLTKEQEEQIKSSKADLIKKYSEK